MLKIVSICDKEYSAIWRLAKGTEKYNQNLDYEVLACHPKRPSPSELEAIERECKEADLIDFAYYKTAFSLMERHPWLKDKKKIVQIHNPYCITTSDWNEFDAVVANNQSIHKDLENITSSHLELIPNTVDTDFWRYNNNWRPNKNILMVANRIEGKKGVLPVAQACKQLGLNFHLVGAISDMNYFNQIMAEGATFHQQISDEELRDIYYNSAVVVINSVPNFESGPLIALEAMCCGIPVLTRKVGVIPDIYNGENMVINEADPEDVEALKTKLTEMLSNEPALKSMRDKAWNTARNRNNERRAYSYQKLYRQVLFPDTKPVSIIVPVYDRPEIIQKNLEAIASQTYKNIELIVADDSLKGQHRTLVESFAKIVKFPVRYMETWQVVIDAEHPDGVKSYGLARARNMGAVKATGELLVFIDQRQIPAENGIEEFVKYAKPRYWIFGDKGAGKKEFVENYSAIYKQDFVIMNMFNERCNKYGSLSELVRKCARYQGLKTEFVESAKAVAMGKSSNRSRKREEIIASKNMIWMAFNGIEW